MVRRAALMGDSRQSLECRMRYAARKDANATEIVNGLRAVGVKVRILNEKDIPDLLVGYRFNFVLMEIKDGSRKPSERKLRPGQQKFSDEWQGYPIYKIESLADAYRTLGITIRETNGSK